MSRFFSPLYPRAPFYYLKLGSKIKECSQDKDWIFKKLHELESSNNYKQMLELVGILGIKPPHLRVEDEKGNIIS